jgi:HEAT repeat protein
LKRKSKSKPKQSRLTESLRQTARSRGMTAEVSKSSIKAGKTLLALLQDPLPTVREAAAFALASLRDPTLVQGFIEAVDGKGSAAFAKAALALGEAGYENVAPYFRAAFTREDRKLSASLARALGSLGDKAAAPLLVEALDGNFVPVEAAEALGRSNDKQAVPALMRALSHRNQEVRAVAAYALACLEPGTEQEEQSVRAELTTLREDRSPKVRLCAAVARFERGETAALDEIRAAIS